MSAKEKALIATAIDALLINPKYPSKEEVLKQKNFKVVMKLINETLHYGVESLKKKLLRMKYTPQLAERTAINIVGKVNIFFNWQLLTQNIEYWLPEGFVDLLDEVSEEEQKALILQVVKILDTLLAPAYTAYLSDEKLDNPIEDSDKMGGYAETAIGKMLDKAEVVLNAIDPRDEHTLEGYKDQFKAKLVEVVDLYIHRYKNQKDDFLNNPEELYKLLDEKELAGFYHEYEFVGLLTQAWIAGEGSFTEQEITEAMYEAVLGLADVLNYELISAMAAKRVNNGEIERKTPLPFTFIIAMAMLGMGEEYGGPGLTLSTADEAYTTALVESQGLVMVANILYLRQMYKLQLSEDKKTVLFLRDHTKKLLSFKELLSPENANLHIFIEICQFLVRLSDDMGDKKNDKKTQSPNLLLVLEELRYRFLDGKKPQDAKAPFNPNETQKIHPADLLDFLDTNEIKKLEDPEQEFGYLGRLSEKSGIDLVAFMNEVYEEFDRGPVSKERIHYWIGRLLGVLDEARALLNKDNTDASAHTSSYTSYADAIETIAKGAIQIGTQFNDEDITEQIKKEHIPRAS